MLALQRYTFVATQMGYDNGEDVKNAPGKCPELGKRIFLQDDSLAVLPVDVQPATHHEDEPLDNKLDGLMSREKGHRYLREYLSIAFSQRKSLWSTRRVARDLRGRSRKVT